MSELSLADLVANRTMSPEIAETLRATAKARRSFLVMAIPRFAGKTTVMHAMLAESGVVPQLTLARDGDDVDALALKARGGYLVVPEVSQAAFVPGYVWGEPVRRAFAAIASGTSLVTALHAPSAEAAIDVLCTGNGVPAEDVARLNLIVYIRALGPDTFHPTRRAVATVHQLAGVRNGRPQLRLRYRWNEQSDVFEKVAG